MTSALVAAGLFASSHEAQAQQKPSNPVQLRVGGYMEQTVGVTFAVPNTLERGAAAAAPASGGPIASEKRLAFDQQTEAEVHFVGDGRLDNGLNIRAVFEMEVSGSPGDHWDEQYLILRNGFGQVILGNEDPVASLMNNGYGFGLVTNAGQSVTYDTQGWLPPPTGFNPSPTAGPARSAFVDYYDSDSSKVVYVSPRIFGAQVGVSYAPESGRDQLTPTQVGGDSDTNKRLPAQGVIHSMWSFGANYEITVTDVKVGLAAGYGTAEAPNNVAPPAGDVPGFETTSQKPQYWVVGLRLDMGPWRFATGYSKLWNSNPTLAANSADGWGWKAGVLYTFGPNAVSLNAQIGTEEGNVQGAPNAATNEVDRVQKIALAYARTLAPGIKWTANLFYANYDSELETNAAPDYHGWAMTSSVRLDF
jgi:predicted porin